MKDGALLFELCRYQEWADEQLVAAVKAYPAAVADARICEGIPHVHLIGSPPTVDYFVWKRKHA